MDDKNIPEDKKKTHRKKHSGVSAEKKKLKNKANNDDQTARQRNPKAFAIQSAVRAERRFRRTEDLTAKRQHIPIVDKTSEEPPPILIAVVGPARVGKTTLIQNLIKSFTRTNVTNINGPITIVTSKKRRITLIECNNDINSMIDIAKCADLVLLMCDASFGFEMEIFEFLNVCQVHGMPKIMGILTHLDAIKNPKTLKRRKKELKHRFWTEVYEGAKLFYLSGIIHGEYLRNEIKNLGRFISIIKFRPLTWRGVHSYLLADRMEDITNTEKIRLEPKCDRDVVLYGYVRGVPMNKENMVHIAGVGDMRIHELSALPDPCPLPSSEKKRNLLEKEKLLYAPMSGVGGIVYDKDAVYIELQGSHSHKTAESNEQAEIVQDLIEKKETLDTQIQNQEFRLFSDGSIIKSNEFKGESNDNENSMDDEDDDVSDDDDDDEQADELDNEIDKKRNSTRRPVGKFDDEEDENEEDDDDIDDDDDDDENNGDSNDDQSSVEDFNIASESSEDEDNLQKNNMSWKDNLAQKSRNAYLERQSNTQNLMKLVYDVFSASHKRKQAELENVDSDDGEIGGLFKVVSKQQSSLLKDKEKRDIEENCFFDNYGAEDRDWLNEMNKSLIKNCFVTGKWQASEDAEELLKMDDLSDEEMFGDFEDLETGEKYGGENDEQESKSVNGETNNKPDRPIYSRVEEKNMTKKELLEKKMKLKLQFDSEYDQKGGDNGRITGDHQFYEELKSRATKQSELNKMEFVSLDDDLRIQIEGHRAGLYVRLGFQNVPCEFVNNFDPTQPILIGSLNMSEESIGYVNCKVKKHRWYKKLLKTFDPLIISLGWRRFQTVPVFAKVEDDFKNRYLKYTPNHVTCSMTFWGPITPQNTGFLAVQTVQQNVEELRRLGFRIAATGCVTETDKSTQIVKKLKLVGTPLKIYKKSAFIQGMFNSSLEVAKFEGAKVKTVSGIRGQIKKANQKPEGSFRATFEDKILLSDIVFCVSWFRVDIPQFYTPITNLLLKPTEKTQWQGMKTLAQLKRERNIKYEAKTDSSYREIHREKKVFKPLVIPKSLQSALPYKDKPKFESKHQKASFDSKRVAIIRSPHEQKIATMMKMIKANYQSKKAKEKKDTKERISKFKAQKEAIELKRLKKQKELKKKICRTISRMDKGKTGTSK